MRRTVCFAALLLLAACGTQPSRDSGPSVARQPAPLPADPVPRKEPRSRYGNGPVYEVYGTRYEVLPTSYGYREQGVASWYGRKFHGRPTSSQEPYDMYTMTAAHKSLPLPTYVEVRNLKNNRKVIVRVNDRGPFVKNRLIDLSYAAAQKLDIVRDGTGLVEIRAISFDDPPATGSNPSPTSDAPGATQHAAGSAAKLFVQVGAFGERQNAERRHRLLSSNGIDQAFVHRDAGRDPAIYRVRIGPLSGVEQYDRLVSELSRMGISETHLVTE